MPRSRGRAITRVLVTNDDGVDALGLDAIVSQLAVDPSLVVSVVAPATNQTGASSSITTGPLEVQPARTASGYAATAVAGTPSDAVLFGILHLLDTPPDLVVSGLNAGPNLADFVSISGTVSAALAAARLGIPGIAASQGLATEMDYAGLTRLVAGLVRRFREQAAFRRGMRAAGPPRAGIVLNVNFPSRLDGTVRGVRVVGLGRLATVTGYAPAGDGRYTPSIVLGDISVSDRPATGAPPTTDLEAFNQGYATVTPLAPDQTLAPSLARFRSLARWRPPRPLHRPARTASQAGEEDPE